jgi:hypothetical protein
MMRGRNGGGHVGARLLIGSLALSGRVIAVHTTTYTEKLRLKITAICDIGWSNSTIQYDSIERWLWIVHSYSNLNKMVDRKMKTYLGLMAPISREMFQVMARFLFAKWDKICVSTIVTNVESDSPLFKLSESIVKESAVDNNQILY